MNEKLAASYKQLSKKFLSVSTCNFLRRSSQLSDCIHCVTLNSLHFATLISQEQALSEARVFSKDRRSFALLFIIVQRPTF